MPPHLPAWKIFYSDGSTFSSAQGGAWKAPKSGVAVVHVEDGRCGRRVLKFCDYYVYCPSLDRWVDCIDSASVILRSQREDWIVILPGEYLREADFQKILIASHEDDYVPRISPDEPPHVAWQE